MYQRALGCKRRKLHFANQNLSIFSLHIWYVLHKLSFFDWTHVPTFIPANTFLLRFSLASVHGKKRLRYRFVALRTLFKRCRWHYRTAAAVFSIIASALLTSLRSLSRSHTHTVASEIAVARARGGEMENERGRRTTNTGHAAMVAEGKIERKQQTAQESPHCDSSQHQPDLFQR